MNLLETFDNYINYPKEQAYNEYLDQKNLKIFKGVLTVLIFIFIIIISVNLGDKESFNAALVLTLINLVLLLTIRIIYKKILNISNVRKYIFIFLIAQLLFLISIDFIYPEEEGNIFPAPGEKKELFKNESADSSDIKFQVGGNKDDTFMSYFFFLTIFLLIFRLSRIEIIQLFLIGLSIPVFLMFIMNKSLDAGDIIPSLIMGLVFLFIALTSEKKRQKNFYGQYDFYFRKNRENLRMKKELNYAREIQLSMLPEKEAVINDISIAGISNPASEVGGDYFDYFKISETEVGIFICDVSGHGVASGLLLSGLRSCMHLILEDNSDPRVVIEKLNRMIRKTQNKKMFVTAIFAIIDLEKSKCMLYNAGHLPPYKISGESKEIFKIKKHGIALGAMNSVEKEGNDNDVIFDFKQHDKIIFYTDGVNEAMNSAKAEYGLDNLEFFLNKNTDKNANELLNALIEDVKKFTGNSIQRDDLTLLIVQRN